MATQPSGPEADCDKGNASACFQAGVKYDSPEDRAPDLPRAADYYRKACDLGNPTGCDNLGLMHAKGEGVPKDPVKAFKLYNKGCQTGYPMACFHVGRARETGTGTQPDPAAAATHYGKVCASDLEKAAAVACFNLGAMKLRGLGVAVDVKEGLRLVELGCKRGNGDSCTTWGVALGNGMGSEPPNLKRAAELFQQGCDVGSLDGCFNLALAYRGGDGVTKSKEQARELLFAACAKGSQASCDELPELKDTAKMCDSLDQHRTRLAEEMGERMPAGEPDKRLTEACKSSSTPSHVACVLSSKGLEEADICVEKYAPMLAVKKKDILCGSRDPSKGINPLLDDFCADSRVSP